MGIWYTSGGRGGASSYGKIYKSNDRINWPELSPLPGNGNDPIRCINGLDSNNIWTGVDYPPGGTVGGIWYYNGSIWVNQYTYPLDYSYISSIIMISSTEGYAVGYRGVTTKTVFVLKWDGNNWNIIHSYTTGGDYATTIHARGNIIIIGLSTSSPGQPIIKYSLDGGSNWNYGADVVSSGGNPIAGGSTSGVWVGDNGKYYWMRKSSGLYVSTDLSVNFTRIVVDSLANGYITGSDRGNSIWSSGGDDIYFGHKNVSGVAISHWDGSSVVATTNVDNSGISSLYGISQEEIATSHNAGLGNGRVSIYNGVTHFLLNVSPSLTGDLQGVYGTGDFDPPYLDSLNPDNNENNIPNNSNVFLKIKDDLSDIDQSTVVIKIDRGSSWENVWLSDTQQSGFSVTKNVINTQEISYDINPDVNFTYGQLVKVNVQCDDIEGNSLDETYEFNIFDPENIFSVDQTNDYELSLNFSYNMETTGNPGDELSDSNSYQINSVNSDGYPEGIFYPSSVNVVSSVLVKLVIPLTTRDKIYKVEIVGDVEDQNNHLLKNSYDEYICETSLPKISSVVLLDERTIKLVFNRDIVNSPELIDPDNYIFNENVKAEFIERLTSTEVKVILNKLMVPGKEYLVRIDS